MRSLCAVGIFLVGAEFGCCGVGHSGVGTAFRGREAENGNNDKITLVARQWICLHAGH